MRVIQYPKDMKDLIGEELGISEWVTVDQAMIDKFAEATGDHQWIHVDVERAKNEMPGGKTIDSWSRLLDSKNKAEVLEALEMVRLQGHAFKPIKAKVEGLTKNADAEIANLRAETQQTRAETAGKAMALTQQPTVGERTQ